MRNGNTKTICFFNTTKVWGGGEKWHYDFALLCRDAGYGVCVVANDPSELYDRLSGHGGITFLRTKISSLSFLNPLALLKLRRFFKRNRVDTVVMALPQDVKAGGLAARLAGVKKIIFRRGLGVPTKNTVLNRFLFKRVLTGLIINSLDTGRMVLSHNPNLMSKDNIHLVHCGFDVAEFDAMKPVVRVERRTPDEVLIGNAGRLTEQKGQRYLIQAARLLKDKGLNFRVVIAGKGELEDELKELAKTLDVRDCVEFPGFVTDMKGFNQSLDIFALPSLFEGFCYAQVEAMVLERPVVAFNVSSIPEVVMDTETGYLVPEKDVAAFADKLALLINDPALRRELGVKGRQRILDNFTMQKTFRDFEQVINS